MFTPKANPKIETCENDARSWKGYTATGQHASRADLLAVAS